MMRLLNWFGLSTNECYIKLVWFCLESVKYMNCVCLMASIMISRYYSSDIIIDCCVLYCSGTIYLMILCVIHAENSRKNYISCHICCF